MQGVLASATTFAAAHPHAAGGLVFLAAALESVAIVGAIVPGTAIVVAVGALIALGHLNLWVILAATAAGAIVGDGVSFWIGHRYRDRLPSMWPFAGRPELLARGEAYITRRGAAGILIARFVPVLRSTVPVTAGMLGMDIRRFYLANIGSALVWAPAHVLPGLLAGTALAGLGAVSLRLATLAISLGLLVWLAIWLARRVVPVGRRWASAARASFLAWAMPRTDRWGRLGRFAVTPQMASRRWRLLLLLFGLACALAFSFLLVVVLGRDVFAGFDAAVLSLLGSLRNEWTDPAMVVATRLGDTSVNVVTTTILVGWLLLRRRPRLAIGVLLTILGASALMTAIKLGVQAGRPPLVAPIANGFSFPSGHSTMAAVVLGLVGWLAASAGLGRWRTPVLTTIGLLILSIAFSRAYLAAHWPSDVLGGLLLGSALVSGFALAMPGTSTAGIAPRRLVALVAAGLVLFGGIRIATRLGPDLAVLRSNSLRVEVLDQAWTAQGWRQLPTHRADLSGEDEEPLILQWRGETAALAAVLASTGWQVAPGWSLHTLSRMLTPSSPATSLPVLPIMDRGQAPALTLVRTDPADAAHRRLVLRAWRARFADPSAPGVPLLLVSVTREVAFTIAHVLTLPRRAATEECGVLSFGPAFRPSGLVLAPRDGGCGGPLLLGKMAE